MYHLPQLAYLPSSETGDGLGQAQTLWFGPVSGHWGSRVGAREGGRQTEPHSPEGRGRLRVTEAVWPYGRQM